MAAQAIHQFAECITCHAWSPDHSSYAPSSPLLLPPLRSRSHGPSIRSSIRRACPSRLLGQTTRLVPVRIEFGAGFLGFRPRSSIDDTYTISNHPVFPECYPRFIFEEQPLP